MPIFASLQEIPKPIWIVAMVLGFAWHWPVGMVVLALMLTAREMQPGGGWTRSRWRQPWSGARPTGPGFTQPPQGHSAFDAYRAETLRRLEDEQQEFNAYLERLRQARDKQEFDQFMADRRRQPPAGEQG
jgi:hypothetical protein